MAHNQHEPYIPASTTLPEITLRALLLSVTLAIVLGAANAYLGLFAGMTVSASIPAAVISMALLRAFSNSNILENNIVQTATSAGESVAAGVIFTIPALIILGTWTRFDYWETTMLAGFGGILGVLFSIPLRRALIVEMPLRFPEGVATAEVLKVGEGAGSGIGHILAAGAIGALFKLGETGLRLWSGVVEGAAYAGGTVLYVGSNLSPALIGVGYIVGRNIAALVFIGGALNWFVAIPLLALLEPVAMDQPPAAAAGALWSTQTRYIGVGAMVVGGLWALVRMRRSLILGIRSGAEAYRKARRAGSGSTLRTERDIPMQWIGVAVVAMVVPLYFIFHHITGAPGVAAVMAAVMLVAGFLFSAVAAYMGGLVGSSNNPISGVTIATILTSALLLLALLGSESPIGPAAAILIGSVVCCAAAMSGDTLQDLKAGYLVGATPYKQQIVQGVGVVSAAVVIAPTLTLLLEAYGIGVPTETHPDPLAAPQATLMASVARGVFLGGLPGLMIGIGMAVALAVILLDVFLERRGSAFRTPVLALAVGIYLPLELTVPIFAGGLIAHHAGRTRGNETDSGVLFAAGLITGEALIGIAMAVPIVVLGRADALAFWGIQESSIPGVALLGVVGFLLYRAGRGARG